jgi:hypothetical protein
MNRAKILYYNLENNIPFSFIKLNDGEISALMDINSSLSRGDEQSSMELSKKIKECLEYEDENYFIGIPCSLCYNGYYNEANKYINPNFQNNVFNANLLINSNIDHTIDILEKTMMNKNIVVVTNDNNLKNINKLEHLNIKPYKIISVSDKNAFKNDYERVKDEWKTLTDGDVIICLCGPIGRVLCYEWFKNNNKLTCLELGSLFDPLLKDRSYLYHTGTHAYCDECFPSNKADDCKLLSLCDNKIYKECYYFHNEEQMFHFYNYNFDKINKNNDIRIEKHGENDFLLKIKQLCIEKKKEEENKKKNIVTIQLDKGPRTFELKKIEPRENNKPIYIVYHIATINDNWIELTSKSYIKLLCSGLLDDPNLKAIKISYLGSKDNIPTLKTIWNHSKVEIVDFGEDCGLFEFPALKLVKDICSSEDCNILYFHCKGILYEKNAVDDWIDFLEYFPIETYKHCLDKLLDYDVVGCNYYGRHGEKTHKQHAHPFIWFYRQFNGNFWWSKSSYINTLIEWKNITGNRLYAEFFICSNEEGKFWSYYVSGKDFGIFPRTKFERSIYEGLEYLDFNFYIENNYKHYSKNELFVLAENCYSSNELVRLNKITNVYLSIFNDFDDSETNNMRFWNSFSNFPLGNYEDAKKQLKILYNSKTIDNNLKFYTKCNLEILYGKNNQEIPKLIHLIYLKGIEFSDFHYACVKSMLNHMPSYKIVIYNDIEPVGNKYWDDLKRYVSIECVESPNEFDDYPLKYIQYKADVIRLEKLYEHGGIYLDLDMLIIKNFEHIINTGKDFYISEEGDKGNGLINCFMASKPKNGFIKKWLETFKVGLRMDNWAYHIRESNKILLDKKKHYSVKYNLEILESKYFLPFKWMEYDKFVNIEENLNDDIHGVHLFETILEGALRNNKYFETTNLKLNESTD